MEQFKRRLMELGIPSWVVVALLELEPPNKLAITLKYNDAYIITVSAEAWEEYHKLDTIPITQGLIVIAYDDEEDYEVKRYAFRIDEAYHIKEVKGDLYVV